MAVEFQAIGAVDSVTGDADTELTIALPAGVITAGDLLVIPIVTSKSALPTATDWTVEGIAGDDTVFLWKIATASESPVTVTVGTNSGASGAMMHFTGNADTGIAIQTYTSSGGSTTLDLPSATVEEGAGLVSLGTSVYATSTGIISSLSRPNAEIRVNDAVAGDGTQRTFCCTTEDNVAAGTVSGATFTMTESSSQWRSNVLLIPAGSGGGEDPAFVKPITTNYGPTIRSA